MARRREQTAHRHRARPTAGPSRVAWRRLVPWPVAAAAGALGSVLAGWLVCAAFCLTGWLSATDQPIGAPLHLAASFFLLANGARVTLAGLTVSVTPLLLTAIVVACGLGVTRFTLRHGFAAAPGASAKRVAQVAGVVAGVYALVTVLLAGATQTTGAVGGGLIGGLVVGFIIGWVSAAPLFGWRLEWPAVVPAWLRALPLAFGAGLGLLAAGGALVLAVALIGAHSRVSSLQAGLSPGVLGGGLLTIGQLGWLPDLVLWGAAWLTGAGFSLGADTVVSPVAVQVGVLPSIPVLGAVPPAGAPSRALLLWLVIPLAAGVAAAWVTLRAQTTRDHLAGELTRPDVGGLIGGATGIMTGLVATALAALSRGDLGDARLTGLGPRLGAMIFLAPTLLGLAGLVAGVVIAWRQGAATGSPSLASEATAAGPGAVEATMLLPADDRPSAETPVRPPVEVESFTPPPQPVQLKPLAKILPTKIPPSGKTSSDSKTTLNSEQTNRLPRSEGHAA